MGNIQSFTQLENRWGVSSAFHCLLELEKAAKIPSWTVSGVDFETRFTRACQAQDAMIESSIAR